MEPLNARYSRWDHRAPLQGLIPAISKQAGTAARHCSGGATLPPYEDKRACHVPQIVTLIFSVPAPDVNWSNV